MYVCLCHGITDKEIRRHVAEAPCSVSAIYRACGVTPKCGKCIPTVRTLVREEAPGLAMPVAAMACS